MEKENMKQSFHLEDIKGDVTKHATGPCLVLCYLSNIWPMHKASDTCSILDWTHTEHKHFKFTLNLF